MIGPEVFEVLIAAMPPFPMQHWLSTLSLITTSCACGPQFNKGPVWSAEHYCSIV
jgi:hypothetical protein